jgi:hypothetical protein
VLENGCFPASSDNACGGFHRTKFCALSHDDSGSGLYTLYLIGATYSHVIMSGPSSSMLQAEVAVAESEKDVYVAVIALYKALGGVPS